MQRRTKAKHKRAPVTRLIPGAKLALVELGKATRFQPGQSGNPSGRPSFMPLTLAYKGELDRQIDRETAIALKIPLDSTIAQGIAAILTRSALCGDVAAAKELADRVQGKAPQFLALATNAPAKTEVVFRVVTDEPKFPVKPELRKFLADVRGIMLQEANDEIIEAAAKLARVLVQKYGTAKA